MNDAAQQSRARERGQPLRVAQSGERFHPIVVPGEKSDEVPGMVFEVTEQDLAATDSYEVADYKRIAVRLKSGLEAWAYVCAQ